MAYQTVKRALEELERQEKIEKGEYRGSYRVVDGKRKTFIIRRKAKKGA